MTRLARIAVVGGDTVGTRAAAGVATSLLTAVGRPVDRAWATDDLTPYAAVVASSATAWRTLRERYGGPVLVVDGDLLDGRVEPTFARLLGEARTDTVTLRDVSMALPRPLPLLTGRALGDAPPGLAAEAAPGLGYVLPVVVTPALRTVAGFWDLARLLESALAALLAESETLYVEPWPRGFRTARALTYDLDALETMAGLPAVVTSGRPATVFCCADALGRLEPGLPGLEIAAHGDVHRAFADPHTALERIDRMLAAFHAADLAPRGFSPPNTAYQAPLAPLLARFDYVRIGYQDRTFRFHPEPAHGGVLASVSYYPDFLHRYIGPEEYARLLLRFCAWAEATSVLAVPCFHPCLWAEPLRRFLGATPGAAWETTLAGVTDWWAHRGRTIAAVAAGGEAAAPEDVVVVRATPARRLEALRPVNGDPRVAPVRAARSVVVEGRRLRVVPAAAAPAAAVDVPLGAGWRALGWLPRRVRRRLVRVVNRNGLHACFYGDLGLAPEIVGGGIRLPIMAADEPVVLADLRGDLRRLARRVLGRVFRARRVPGTMTHA